VIARHAAGESARRIAAEEGLDRATVSRVLTQRQVVQMFAQYQTQLLSLVPKAIGVYDAALSSRDERVRVAVGTKILEGLQVLNRGGIEQAIEMAGRAAPEADRLMRKRLELGKFMEVLVAKKERYGIPLPPEFDGLEKVTKQLEGPAA